MENLEIKAVIKYFCKKGMSPKAIHEDIMETLEKESPFYSTVKKWAAEFKRGIESVEDDGRCGCPKDANADENVKVVHILVMCDRSRDLPSIASEVSSTINPNRHLRYVKGFGKMVATNFDQKRT